MGNEGVVVWAGSTEEEEQPTKVLLECGPVSTPRLLPGMLW